jgi:hypothetical protein
MDVLSSSRKIFEELRSDPLSTGILGALAGAFFLLALVSWSIEHAATRHWSLGMLLTAASLALVMWLAIQAASFDPKHPISIVIFFFILSVLGGSVVFSGISFILYTQGWARYGVPQDVELDTFRNYYLWIFLDMIPAINVWSTVPVESPIQPHDAVAGTPPLAFKVFILGFVFAGIARWWKLRGVVASPEGSGTDVDPNRQ